MLEPVISCGHRLGLKFTFFFFSPFKSKLGGRWFVSCHQQYHYLQITSRISKQKHLTYMSN